MGSGALCDMAKRKLNDTLAVMNPDLKGLKKRDLHKHPVTGFALVKRLLLRILL